MAVQPFQLPLDSLFSSLTEPAPVRAEQASSRRRSGVGRTVIAIAATSVFFGGLGSVYMHSAMDDMSMTGSSTRTTAPAMAPGTAAMPAPAAAMSGAGAGTGADAAPPRPLGNGMPMPATAAAAAPMNYAPADASPMASGPMASPVTASSRISSEESAASTPARSKPSSKATKSSKSSAGTSVRRVTVGEGDSFSTLASRYDVSEARIAALNPGVDSSDLTIGQSLRVK